jgi:hypothetical protein
MKRKYNKLLTTVRKYSISSEQVSIKDLDTFSVEEEKCKLRENNLHTQLPSFAMI